MGGMREVTQKIRDRMDPARADALAALLGRQTRDKDDALIPFGHQVYFWDAQPAGSLGEDGHPALGGFIPNLGLNNRMWAGGDLTFHAPLRLGIAADKTSRVLSVTEKQGRSGLLAFVQIEHQIHQRGALTLTEIQDVVYTEAQGNRAPDASLPRRADAVSDVIYDEVALFRYSALTFNGHRIHYDKAFCTDLGHPGLIVHGPLLAQTLIGLWMDHHGPLRKFVFRAQTPLFHTERLRACIAGQDLWIEGPDGRIAMTARGER